MRREIRLTSILALGACAAALAARPPAAPPPPSFGETVEVNVVNVDVYAADKSGNRVRDLRKGDFQVFEDGKAVEISNFELVEGLRQEPAAPPASAPGASAAPASPEDVWNLVILFDD